jgi:hypothetical protein
VHPARGEAIALGGRGPAVMPGRRTFLD